MDWVVSTYFADRRRFPTGSLEYDCTLVMRDVPHEWHPVRTVHPGQRLCGLSVRGPCSVASLDRSGRCPAAFQLGAEATLAVCHHPVVVRFEERLQDRREQLE